MICAKCLEQQRDCDCDSTPQPKLPPSPKNPLSQQEYVVNCGALCPCCGLSDCIVGDDVEILTTKAEQAILCSNCGATWTDSYKLMGYENLEPNMAPFSPTPTHHA